MTGGRRGAVGQGGQLMSSQNSNAHPPRPRLTLRVGLTGKRAIPEADVARIRASLAAVFEALAAFVADRRAEHRAVLSDEPALLRIISGMAEGADQIAAEVAIERFEREAAEPSPALRTSLAAILPFARDEYEKDFAQNPNKPEEQRQRTPEELEHFVHRFRGMLGHKAVEAVLEIDDETLLNTPNPDDRSLAYANLRDVLLEHSDVLVAVSDEVDGGAGGSVDVIRAAVREGIPVLNISIAKPEIYLMRTAEPDDPDQTPKEGEEFRPGGALPTGLVELLKPTLSPPLAQPLEHAPNRAAGNDHRHSHTPARAGLTRLAAFLGETFAPVSFGWIFKACRNGLVEWAECNWRGCFGAAWKAFQTLRKTYHIDSPSEALAKLWLKDDGLASVYTTEERFRRILVRRHIWADTLAVCYADATRSSYIAIACFGALAVLVGLLAVLFWGGLEAPAKIVVLLLEGAILWLTGWHYFRPAHRDSWHERMVEYRVLAELLRHQRFIYAFGGAERFERTGDRSWREPDAWLSWYVRATTRELGFPTVRLSAEYRRAALNAFQREELLEQINYNNTERRRTRTIDESLGTFIQRTWGVAVGTAISGAMLVAVLYAVELSHGPFYHEIDVALRRAIKPALTIIMAFLPALIAAVHGVRFQMEFANAAKRAETTYRELSVINVRRLKPMLDDAEPPRRKSYALVRLANEAMVSDLAGWSTVYQNKAAEPPG
jgi:hypothetical protein